MQFAAAENGRPVWTPDAIPSDHPLYLSIADSLERDVRRGALAPGDRLPTLRAMARELGVNVMTVSRGYAEAARRGLVQGEVGRGTFVLAHKEGWSSLATLAGGAAGRIDFAFNLPALDLARLRPRELLAELAGRADELGWNAGYEPAGLAEHRRVAVSWLARFGVAASAERVLVTGGVQHGLAAALSASTSPGDTLAVEALTYTGIRGLAGALHLRLAAVRCDEDGLDPDGFAALCRSRKVRVLYTMPTLHNPTGSVLPAERRVALVELARRHGVTLVEDDCYGFLCSSAPPPLAALAPERTYFLTGTSKSLAAGLRIGFMATPPSTEAHRRACERAAAFGWMASPLTAEMACCLIRSGRADELVAERRRECSERRALFDARAPHGSAAAHPSSPHLLWPLPAEWAATDFEARALARGVAVTPAEVFAVEPAAAPRAVRLCLGTPPTREQVMRGLEVLGELVRGVPRAAAAVL